MFTSARATANRSAEAHLLNSIGNAHYFPRRFESAQAYFTAARAIWDVRGQALVANNPGNVMAEQRFLREGIAYYERAVALQGPGVVHTETATALTNLAESYCRLGEFGTALTFAEQARRVHRVSGNGRAEALTLGQSGNSLHGLGAPGGPGCQG